MTLCELRDLAAKKLKSYREDCATVARWESETAILGHLLAAWRQRLSITVVMD